MNSLLEYYRDPVFSILLLICLLLLISIISMLANSFKQRILQLKARQFTASFEQPSDLGELSSALLAEFGAALLAQNRALRARECFLALASRNVNCAYELAVCNIRLGLFSQAMANCELSLAHVGRDARALKALIYAALKLGDMSTAADAARALALCDEANSAALKYLQGDIKLSADLGDQRAFVCPKCSHLGYKFEPFCPGCFEFCEPKTYLRTNNDANLHRRKLSE